MWITINLVLWLAMLGALFAPTASTTAKYIAIAGVVFAAFCEHAVVRGFVKPKK
jgi:hypothetical protein